MHNIDVIMTIIAITFAPGFDCLGVGGGWRWIWGMCRGLLLLTFTRASKSLDLAPLQRNRHHRTLYLILTSSRHYQLSVSFKSLFPPSHFFSPNARGDLCGHAHSPGGHVGGHATSGADECLFWPPGGVGKKSYAGSRRKRIVAAVNGLGGGIQADSWINDDLKGYILFDKMLNCLLF